MILCSSNLSGMEIGGSNGEDYSNYCRGVGC